MMGCVVHVCSDEIGDSRIHEKRSHLQILHTLHLEKVERFSAKERKSVEHTESWRRHVFCSVVFQLHIFKDPFNSL